MSERKPTLESFGKLIAERRNALGISQEEFAERADLDRTYISGLERGVRNPSLTAIVKVAKGFGILTEELLSGLEAKAKSKGR
ncbi:MAG TPA: helix-turn-helix transcriptional regulator [Candidatus Paceibacterota bacterium]|nr:helix-turn-helix transcriptional regulator [Candidatus Paceibacterota bacterium]